MPALTIAALATSIVGNATPTSVSESARKSLMLVLVSGDAYIGWTSTVSAAGVDDAGIPLTIGIPVTFDGETLRFNSPLRAYSPAGCVINYQELRTP